MQERTAPSSWGEEDGGAEGMNKEPEWCGSFRSPPAHGGAPGCVPAPVGAFSPLPFISSFCSTCRCGNRELCQRCAGAQAAAQSDAAAVACREVPALLNTVALGPARPRNMHGHSHSDLHTAISHKQHRERAFTETHRDFVKPNRR